MKMETVMEEGDECASPWNFEEDISQLCRICANSNEYLIPIFQGEGLEHELKNKICKHLPIKVSEGDKLPTNLCYQCASTLIAWHDMVVGCLEADEKLRALAHDDDGRVEIDTQPDDSKTKTITEADSGMERTLVEVAKPEKLEENKIHYLVQQKKLQSAMQKVEVEEEVTTIEHEPELVEEVSSEPRCDEMEEDNIDGVKCYRLNGIQNNDTELDDDFMSDSESDEEFRTLYSCNICDASNMVIGDFLKHTMNHSRKERQSVLEKLADSKIKEELAARNAAAAYGFQAELSLVSSVTLYLCTVCGQGNLLLKNLKEHSALHPQLSDSHYCNLCEQQFLNKSRLSAHLETHLDNNDLICQYCNRKFNMIEDLEEHERSHHRAEYVCVECREHFRYRELILLHLKQTHCTGNTCHICDKDFQTENAVSKHFMTHAEINVVKRVVKSFACDFCAKKYDSKVSLQRHVLFLHNDRMPYICEHCGFTAYHQDPLKEHLKTEHSCNQTNTSFIEKSELETHMTEHQEKRTYHCNFCKMRFKCIKNLNYHLTSHGYTNTGNFVLESIQATANENGEPHQCSDDEFLFVCHQCERTFDDEELYNDHQKNHLPFVACNLCSKTFQNDQLLNVHLNKVHTSKFCRPDLKGSSYPFQCSICNTTFKLEFELEDHKKIHEVPSYQCHLCFQEFIMDRELQTHINTHDEDPLEIEGSSESLDSDTFTLQ